jgi:hypothetical protein
MLLEFLLVLIQLLVTLPDEARFNLHGLCIAQAHINIALDYFFKHLALDRLSIAILRYVLH